MAGHETVLRAEAVHALVQRTDGRFADCTYGRGGHSVAILERLNESGRLIALDKDPEAIRDAKQRLGADERVMVVHGSFKDLPAIAEQHDMLPLDGVLMDLGVSSPQIDSADRGFSFDRQGTLDMRMDSSQGISAKEWLAETDEREIARVLREYGEERFARRIARGIVEARAGGPIETTGDLVEIIESSIPRREKHKHPATRSFQAIRIEINRELDELQECLASVVDLLSEGGRLVVISFHSLEDRIVKRFMRDMAKGDPFPSRLPIRDDQLQRRLKIIGRPVKPGEEEIRNNRRARSATMRVAERLGS
ncbi:MAG: 16S rRNA (cytosine(1402)-N(4))-methyltransferase RsmH [Pseudomonadales bacterium]|nr:16S rRNA (cytosine(1402)-N(4))-methyltransferase RsmH [Pseudomonadales bacterium]